MSALEVSATRMELFKIKTKLDVARKGHRLLKNKLDGMIRKVLELNKQIKKIEEEVFCKLQKVFLSFELARNEMDPLFINFLFSMFQCTKLDFKMLKRNIMGVKLVKVDFKPVNFNFQLDGLIFSESTKLVDGVLMLSEIFPRLVKLAEMKKSCNILQNEIVKTRRKVNALEHLIVPNYMSIIKTITLKLEENERNNLARLSRIKN